MNKFLNKILNKLIGDNAEVQAAKKEIKKRYTTFRRKNMKLGASYNIFDGEELLPYSIKTIRKHAKYISVVYQTTSNFGNKASADLKEKLEALKNEGLIDELYFYEPDLKISAHQNEKNKRNIGLKLAKKNGCNYFISLDADEFYDEVQFDKALNYIVLNNIKSSAVNIVEYLKSFENQLVGSYTFTYENDDLYNFYVPFVIKISKFKNQKHGEGYFPCLTDLTRHLFHAGRFRLFAIQDIAMHHMSTVRKDLSKKYDNSSLLDSPKEIQEHVKNLQKEIIDFDFDKSKVLPEDCSIFRKNIVKKVPNKFNIELL